MGRLKMGSAHEPNFAWKEPCGCSGGDSGGERTTDQPPEPPLGICGWCGTRCLGWIFRGEATAVGLAHLCRAGPFWGRAWVVQVRKIRMSLFSPCSRCSPWLKGSYQFPVVSSQKAAYRQTGSPSHRLCPSSSEENHVLGLKMDFRPVETPHFTLEMAPCQLET